MHSHSSLVDRYRTRTARCWALTGVAAGAALALTGCHGTSASASGGSGAPAARPAPSSGPAGPGSGGGSAATTAVSYFPIGASDTWVYGQQGFGGKGTVTNKMVSVTPTAAGQRVVMRDTLTYPKATTINAVMIFRPDGSIQVPLTQFAGTSVTIKTGTIVWPNAAELASGRPYHDKIVIQVKEAGHSMTISMPVTVTGMGTTTLSVLAGTYHTTIINEAMTMSMMGYKTSMSVRTWVANGVGPVKSQVFSGMLGGSGNSAATTEVLESFHKG